MLEPKTISVVDDFSYTPLCSEIDPNKFPKISVGMTGNVKINGSMENIEFLMKEYGITCRYNMITREEEVKIPSAKFTADNMANSSINTVINLCINNNVPKGDALGHIKAIADKYAYNPVVEWIDSKPWDGVDRLSDVINRVEVVKDYEKVRDIYLHNWFRCAVGMLENGTKGMNLDYEGILVFQGSQGIGKTSWFKGLVEQDYRHLVRDGFELDLNSKDSRISFSSHWMVELGELDATFKKSEVSALKAFTTMSSDKVRRPYDRVDTTMFRRTVMFASVNDMQFLQDDTGNRRFWCLPVTGLSLPENFNPQQFWAQVKHELNQMGGARVKPWYVTGEDRKLRDDANELFQAADPIEEMILSTFDKSKPCEYRATATMLVELFGLPISKVTTNTVSKHLKKHFGDYRREGTGRFFSVPKPRNTHSKQLKEIGFKPNH